MAIIQQKERELRYAKTENLQQESLVSANYIREMIRSYGLDLRYYKLKCPYPEVFRPILDLNNLTMHAYGYDPAPEYEIETPVIGYWKFEEDTLLLNQYGIQPNRVAKCWIDATDFAIAFARKLAEYKEYKIAEQPVSFACDGADDFMENADTVRLKFDCGIFSGTCRLEFLDSQKRDIVSYVTGQKPFAPMSVQCRVSEHGSLKLVTPHVVPDLLKGMKYEDFIDDIFEPYIRLDLEEVEAGPGGSFTLSGFLRGAVIYFDLNVISRYLSSIKPEVGDVISVPVLNHGDTLSRFEITHIQGTKYNEGYMNPFLRQFIYECDLRTYVSSGEAVPERREEEKKYRTLDDLVNFAASDAGRKMSFYQDREEDVYGGYDKIDKINGDLAVQTAKQADELLDFPDTMPPEPKQAESSVRIADLDVPAKLSLVLSTNSKNETWLQLKKTEDVSEIPLREEPWQKWFRCSDNSLIMKYDGRAFRLASFVEECETEGGIVKPRPLKPNTYTRRGDFPDQPFNLYFSEEETFDFGLYSEALLGDDAGSEYKGAQIKNSGLSRMTWRNTRSYMDVKVGEDGSGYVLSVVFSGDKRRRRFPIAKCEA